VSTGEVTRLPNVRPESQELARTFCSDLTRSLATPPFARRKPSQRAASLATSGAVPISASAAFAVGGQQNTTARQSGIIAPATRCWPQHQRRSCMKRRVVDILVPVALDRPIYRVPEDVTRRRAACRRPLRAPGDRRG
jgi:hypothetical protein